MSFGILPAEPPSTLAQLLTGAGTGIAQGLQESVSQFNRQKTLQEGLEGIGIDPQRAQGISKLPPELQKIAISGAQGVAGRELAPLLQQLGLPSQKAGALGELFERVGTGGQTEVVKLAIEQLQRSG